MPCAKAMVAKVCGEDQVKKLNTVSLSNNTIRRRVDDMAEDILVQMTDEVNSSQVFSSIRWVHGCQQLCCSAGIQSLRSFRHDQRGNPLCENLTTTTKGEDMFNTFFGEQRTRLASCLPSGSWRCTSHDGCSTRLQRFKKKKETRAYKSISAPFISILSDARHCQLPWKQFWTMLSES